MKFQGFKTVEGKPAIFHEEMDLLVIADLHLGLEGSMTSKGSYVPKFQLDDIKEEIQELQDETQASRILVNGDLKNQYSTSYTEKQELDEFLEFLQETFEEVILIKGNHDTILDNTAEKHGLELKDYFVENDILFTHGHMKLGNFDEEYDTVVMGHEHPALALTDDVGVKEKVSCVLYGELEEDLSLIVLPAYSKISNGSEVNNMPRSEFLCPVLREYGVDGLKATAVSREAGNFEFPEISKIN
ncbi:metallophosphoesterase [Candidatus Nanohalobium constans]|uniref:Metallophosphoesterase n=1 Tax=Candidatus Nanohalobium constans TaxID=2565781 RepID=A0A5Q0UGF4_9ARCH|nr:metallophosphoesterase [Candidatus Nanohalobium constans]QGA80687.1 metallophosphoesterase [Candidatus Nanohalobium constans]